MSRAQHLNRKDQYNRFLVYVLKKKAKKKRTIKIQMPLPGVEPGRKYYPQTPQACVSTNSTITAFILDIYTFFFNGKRGIRTLDDF